MEIEKQNDCGNFILLFKAKNQGIGILSLPMLFWFV